MKGSRYKQQNFGMVLFGLAYILIGIGWFNRIFHIPGNDINQWGSGGWWTESLETIAYTTVLFWLGIGSILAQRWVRPLVVILSWIFIITNGSVVLVKILFPGLYGQSLDWIISAFLIYVAVPLGSILFYGHPRVVKAFQPLDPKVRWTDRFSWPVLTIIVVLSGLVLTLIVRWLANHFEAVYFGYYFDGLFGAFLQLLEISWIGALLLLILRSHPYGWEMTALYFFFNALSATFTRQVNLFELFQGNAQGGFLTYWMGFLHYLVPWITVGFLIWFRKYFKTTPKLRRRTP